MNFSTEQLAIIGEILADYLERPFPGVEDLRAVALEHSAVPTFRNWTETTFLKTDGTFFKYETDDFVRAGEITPEMNQQWQHSSLRYAAGAHPRFLELLPKRPVGAATCPVCQGEGLVLPRNVVNPSKLACSECWGVGWNWREAGG